VKSSRQHLPFWLNHALKATRKECQQAGYRLQKQATREWSADWGADIPRTITTAKTSTRTKLPIRHIARWSYGLGNISTQQNVSDLAGRGVGLAAVLNETKIIGGEVVVKTMVGQGTQFLFTLPVQPAISDKEV
jgi:hypothetical protein